jgi:hypothetical protein
MFDQPLEVSCALHAARGGHPVRDERRDAADSQRLRLPRVCEHALFGLVSLKREAQ